MASTTSSSAGLSRTASPTCLARVKPGRMYGIHAARSPKHLGDDALAVLAAGDHVGRVRVGVVDVGGGDESVQERLDRGPRHRRIEHAAREVGDHLLVAHLGALDQGLDLVQAQRREVPTLHRRQIGAGALHPQGPQLAPDVVGAEALRRGVPAAVVGDAAIGAEEARREHELVQGGARELPGAGGPKRLDGRRLLGRRAHLFHPLAIVTPAPRSAAIRST